MPTISSYKYETTSSEFLQRMVKFLNICYPAAPYDVLNPWPRLKPIEFLILHDGDTWLGNQSLFVLQTSASDKLVMGLGDLAITPKARGMGNADQLITTAIKRVEHMKADVVLTNSVLMRDYFLHHGFISLPEVDMQFHYVNNGVEVRDPGKLARWLKGTSTNPITIFTPYY